MKDKIAQSLLVQGTITQNSLVTAATALGFIKHLLPQFLTTVFYIIHRKRIPDKIKRSYFFIFFLLYAERPMRKRGTPVKKGWEGRDPEVAARLTG
jgi:hypothetical protein